MWLFPRGVHPSDAVNDRDHGKLVSVAVAFCTTLSLLLFCARLLARWPWRSLFGKDDAVTAAASVRIAFECTCHEWYADERAASRDRSSNRSVDGHIPWLGQDAWRPGKECRSYGWKGSYSNALQRVSQPLTFRLAGLRRRSNLRRHGFCEQASRCSVSAQALQLATTQAVLHRSRRSLRRLLCYFASRGRNRTAFFSTMVAYAWRSGQYCTSMSALTPREQH